MRIISAFSLLFLTLMVSFAHAIELEPVCPFCHAIHQNSNNIILENNIINVDFLGLNQALTDYPCLAVQIGQLAQSDFMPQRAHESCVQRVLPGNYALSKDHLLRLLFLSSIRAENHKMPITLVDNLFWHQRIPQDNSTKRALAWITAGLFVIFSGGGSLNNFFGFIMIYSLANATNTPTPNLDNAGTLWAQNVPQSFVAFICGLLSSLTNFSWTEFTGSALELRITNMQDRIHVLDEDFRDLSLALLILSFHQPQLGQTLANEIDQAVLLERISDLQPPRRGPVPQGVMNFLSVIEYIKTKGMSLPKSLELQTVILMLERMF